VGETIPELLEAAAEAVPDRPWLVTDDAEYTYAQAREAVLRAAGALAGAGVGRGDLVLTVMHNTPGHLLTWLAGAYLGAIGVPVNPRSSATELDALEAQAQPRVALRTPAEVDALFAADPLDGPAPARPEDPVVLMPTSGTTGRSKLVTQTHRAYAWAGEGFPWWLGLTADDRLMTSLPLFHVNALAYSTMGSIAARASLVLLPRFSASTFLDSARRHGATEFNAIGAMVEILMRQPERPDDADNPLRLCYTGPSPTEERQLEIERRFGLEIVCGYAMSETTYGMIWPRGTRPYGTLGSARQHPRHGTVNEARVMRDGAAVRTGEVGELQLRNPAVMLGYWGMPEETERVLLPDGWLRTGDLVHENPDGTFTFVGREKEVIRRRGENLAPAEVEEALASHPAVAEAAVVGVPSELSEEEVKAFVVLEDPEADLGAVRAWAAERLAPFKVPRYVEPVEALPHTATGRIAKHELPRERTAAEADFG
jgi:crotonobetaine/carnitine-CoA ligase